MGMPRKEAKIGDDIYSFYLVGGLTAYQKLAKYGGNFSKMVANLVQGNLDEFNKVMSDLLDEKEIIELFNTFVGDTARGLQCGGITVTSIDEHFSGKASKMYQLLFEAIKANDQDFFTSLPTLINSLVGKLTEKLQANLSQNPSEMQNDQNEKSMEILTQMAKKAKEALS